MRNIEVCFLNHVLSGSSTRKLTISIFLKTCFCVLLLWIDLMSDMFLLHIKPPWRNRLARSAVNRKVGGSSPPGGATHFCWSALFCDLETFWPGQHSQCVAWLGAWLVGLGVWFSLRVREVPGSNPGRAHQLFTPSQAVLPKGKRERWLWSLSSPASSVGRAWDS